jgi:hypothetical protein
MITLLITLVLFGFALWLVSLIPMDATVRKIVFGVAILVLILWLLNSFGVLGGHGFGNTDLNWHR